MINSLDDEQMFIYHLLFCWCDNLIFISPIYLYKCQIELSIINVNINIQIITMIGKVKSIYCV